MDQYPGMPRHIRMRQGHHRFIQGWLVLVGTIALGGCQSTNLPSSSQIASARTEAARSRSSLYVPSDSLLLAETRDTVSVQNPDSYPRCVDIATEIAYTSPRSFPEILNDYRTNLASVGWDVSPLRDQVRRGADFFNYGLQGFLTIASYPLRTDILSIPTSITSTQSTGTIYYVELAYYDPSRVHCSELGK